MRMCLSALLDMIVRCIDWYNSFLCGPKSGTCIQINLFNERCWSKFVFTCLNSVICLNYVKNEARKIFFLYIILSINNSKINRTISISKDYIFKSEFFYPGQLQKNCKIVRLRWKSIWCKTLESNSRNPQAYSLSF